VGLDFDIFLNSTPTNGGGWTLPPMVVGGLSTNGGRWTLPLMVVGGLSHQWWWVDSPPMVVGGLCSLHAGIGKTINIQGHYFNHE